MAGMSIGRGSGRRCFGGVGALEFTARQTSKCPRKRPITPQGKKGRTLHGEPKYICIT